MSVLGRYLALVAISAACSHPVSSPPGAPAAPVCAPHRDEDVVKAVAAMYDALRADDVAAFRARTSPDFYAFEQGKRMDGDTLPKVIAEAHAKGRRFEWTIKQPSVRVDCNLAVISYVNEGAIGDASGMKPLSWVESAALSYDAGAWHVRFFHSTRVPAEP